jgi:hypothetical protein
MVWLAHRFNGWMNRVIAQNLTVEMSPEDIARLKQYQGESMLLLPNHPSNLDPYVMFSLSKMLKEPFNYVAAREIFDDHAGLQGLFLQALGCYSVIRGAADRESFKTTREFLKLGLSRLVIFFEGEVSHENDTLIPFESGVLQLAFWGLEDRMKLWKEENRVGEARLWIAPLSIKYRYPASTEPLMMEALSDLEEYVFHSAELKAHPRKGMDVYDRIRALGNEMLRLQELRLGLKSDEDLPLNDRLALLKERLLGKLEHFLDIAPKNGQDFLDRIRTVRNKLDKTIYTYGEPGDLTDYQERLLNLTRKELTGFYDELGRLVNLLLLREGSVADHRTLDRFVDVIRRLEREAYGNPKLDPPRTAFVRCGNVFNLAEHYPAYLESKKQTIQSLAITLEQEIQSLIQLG